MTSPVPGFWPQGLNGSIPLNKVRVVDVLKFHLLPRCQALGIEQVRQQPVFLLAEMAEALRRLLWDRGFVEFPVPALRKHDCCSVLPRFRLQTGQYLHESPAHALRKHLELWPKIFSISQCYRTDPADKTHLQQFYMLDLYMAKKELADAISLFVDVVGLVYDGEIKKLSIGEFIKEKLGVDLFMDADAERKLSAILQGDYAMPGAPLVNLVDRWIVKEVEPLSKGSCLLVTDFPSVTEARAKRKDGALYISDIAEVQINGSEVVQIYEDDPDLDGLSLRAKAVGQDSDEDEIVKELIEAGSVPRRSAGGAIGLERLCAACLGIDDIRSLLPSAEFV